MHVLVVPSHPFVPPDAPLSAIFQYDQAHALASAGVRVGVIAPEMRSLRRLPYLRDWTRFGSKSALEDGIPVFRRHGWHWAAPRIGLGHGPVWMRAAKKLFAEYLGSEGKPDIVHAHNARYAGMLGAWVKERYRIPFVLTEHSSAYVRGQVPAREVPDVARAFACADAKIVVSSALGADLERLIGPTVLPYRVIPNLVDPIFESAPLAPARSHEDRFRFVSIGQLDTNKGHADLLAACALLKAGTKFELRIVGGGPMEGSLRTLAQSLGLADTVEFVGRLGRKVVLQELMAADALIVSSHRETFGVVIIEALACGKPVLATRCGGPEEIVDSTNGYLVNPSAPRELADAMRSMIQNAATFEGPKLRAACIERYGRAAIVARLLETYAAVLSVTARSSA